MANKSGQRFGVPRAALPDAGAIAENTGAPNVSGGNGNASGSDSPTVKQSGSWQKYAAGLVKAMEASKLVPCMVLTSLAGAPEFFTCRGYGIHVKPSDELLTIVYSNGERQSIN